MADFNGLLVDTKAHMLSGKVVHDTKDLNGYLVDIKDFGLSGRVLHVIRTAAGILWTPSGVDNQPG